MSDITRTILQQLGGNHFMVMTGCKAFSNGDSLILQIPRNMSKANRLSISLNGKDLYNMCFYHFQAGHLNKKILAWIPERIIDVKTYDDVYADNLASIFTSETGMDTKL